MSKLTCVDIDKLMGSFTLLEKKITGKISENNILEVKLDDAQRVLKFSLSKERCLMEERDSILATVNILQQTVRQHYNLRDINENLKEKMAEMERQNERRVADKESEIQRMLAVKRGEEARHQRELETTKQCCRHEIEDVQKLLEAKDAEVEKLLESKAFELEGMRNTLKNQEKEKQNELFKLRMEFGTTLAKVQNSVQHNQQQLQQPPNYVNQNIFKRKLQFIQEEKNREIEALRQRIKELETQQRVKGPSETFKRRRI